MGRARDVAVRDRRELLHVRAEDLGEGLALGVAQFRELLGDVRDRAVVLTDLDAVPDGARRRREPGVVERVRDLVGGAGDVAGSVGGCDAIDDGVDAAPRELGDRGVAADLAELTQRGAREVVVRVAEPAAPLGRDLESFRRPPAAAGRAVTVGDLAGLPRLDERVEVPSHARRGEAEGTPHLARGDGALLQQHVHHGGPGVALVRGGPGCGGAVCRPRAGERGVATRVGSRRIGFHNTSVT